MDERARDDGGQRAGMRLYTGKLLTLLALSLAVGLGPWVMSEVRAAGVLLAIMGQPRPAPLRWLERSVEVTDETLSLPSSDLRARRYRPAGDEGTAPPLVLLHGVHPDGIDEARLIAFARAVAGAGLDVLTPELPELAQLRVDASTVPRIVQSTRSHARRTGRDAAAVIGISFAGGLALVAAAQERLPWASLIVTVGSHHDLARLARYYAGEPIAAPDGRTHSQTAHPYGARVIIHAHAGHFFPAADVARARALLERWIAGDIRQAQARVGELSEGSRAAMREVLDWRNQAPLGEQILSAVAAESATLAAASPAGKLHDVTLPVYVLHGADDPIIPSTESMWLADELPKAALARTLITPVVRHAELPEDPAPRAYFEIVDFMGAILRGAASPRNAKSSSSRVTASRSGTADASWTK